MSSNFTTNFNLQEKIEIHTFDDPERKIPFKSTISLPMEIDCLKQPADWFTAAVKEWISRIEFHRDLFTISPIPPLNNSLGGVEIKYDNKTIANLILQNNRTVNDDGKTCYIASVRVKRLRFEDEVFDNNQEQTIFFNDPCRLTATRNGKIISFLEALDDIIPIRSEAIVKAIAYVFQIRPEDIILDSFKKKYIITTPYIFRNLIEQNHPTRFYKYVSLQTYHNMLQHKTFRMNSIVSQSDETESWYVGNFLCEDYENKIDRMKYIIKESNTLISSFTTSPNDPFMWENYGDKGKGVVLGFEPLEGNILSSVKYINEDSPQLRSIKDNLKEFKKEEIQISFSEIDLLHRLIKNNMYESEKEWRLIKEFNGQLDSAVYNDPQGGTDTYAYFHDFPFQGDLIPDLKMKLVSVTFGPNQRFNNIPILTKQTSVCFGKCIDVSPYRD